MSDTTLTNLLDSALPGMWLAENRRIWQMKLLKAGEFANFCSKRGLSSFNEYQIICLWQLGLLKADLIECEEELAEDTTYEGLVARGMNRNGYYLYSDERELYQRSEGWADAANITPPLRKDITLFFHPFRYYALYHIHEELGSIGISWMQFFNQSTIPRLLEMTLASFDYRSRSDRFVPSIKTWNEIASLCIITEPCAYQRIFGTIRYGVFDVTNRQEGFEEIRNHIADYWDSNVKNLYITIGIERLEEIRKDIGFDTKQLDPNEWVHTLLCLGQGEGRLELEGHLGGALLLRTMAEITRRASEEAFDRDLPEEDELGFGKMEDIKKKLYGSNRLLENRKAASTFLRWHGLNYKPRIHFYVEGSTEYGAVSYFFKVMGISIPVTNLHGLIKMKSKDRNQMVTFFKDSLLEDIKDHVYSIVVIDGDLRDNVRVIENHARINQTSPNEGMFGRFFLSQPDFEYENFEGAELEEIIWNWVTEYTGENPTKADRELLHSEVKDAVGSTEFFRGIERIKPDHPYLPSGKDEMWGEKLMEYALEHPFRQGRKRKINEIVELALRWETITAMELYEDSKKSNMIHPETGELIPRLSK